VTYGIAENAGVSKPEWVPVYDAVVRLATEWGIDYSLADQRVRNVLKSGKVLVRGALFGSTIPEFITNEIAAFLSHEHYLIIPREWHDVELDWTGLLEHGRSLIPSGFSVHEQQAMSIEAAITEQLKQGVQPGNGTTWADFCNTTRDRANGWSEGHTPKRGFSKRNIQRLVGKQM
jgi:hypothetical protein